MTLEQAGLSPEQAAKRLGVSHMTLRRWQAAPGDTVLSSKYERGFRPAIESLVAEGLIGRNSPAARSLVEDRKVSFQAILRTLGFPENFLDAGPHDRRVMLNGLSKVGADSERKNEVDRSTKKIASFARLGNEWKERINGLLAVIRSKDLIVTDKFVAYGALFYLLMPFDLIPDTIPVIGLLDDFAFLGIALWFYKKRFPTLVKKY